MMKLKSNFCTAKKVVNINKCTSSNSDLEEIIQFELKQSTLVLPYIPGEIVAETSKVDLHSKSRVSIENRAVNHAPTEMC